MIVEESIENLIQEYYTKRGFIIIGTNHPRQLGPVDPNSIVWVGEFQFMEKYRWTIIGSADPLEILHQRLRLDSKTITGSYAYHYKLVALD